MTWIAWRVQRSQYLVAAGVVVALALWLAVSGLNGQAGWSRLSTTGDTYGLYALPGLLGLALGAQLIATEIERGTNRMAWTQSISRARWLAGKLLVGGLVTAGLVALLMPLLGWWIGAMRTGPDIVPKYFGITGVAGVGYAVFAYLLGAALGTVISRPGWAFAAGLPVFIAARLLIDGLRPTLVAPAFAVERAASLAATQAAGWVLNAGYLPLGRTSPAAGQTWASSQDHLGSCFYQAQSQAGMDHCAAAARLHLVVEYQPESHYWALQGVETAIYLAMAVVLAAVTVVAVRRWRT
jgi:hypothetical protein